MLKYSIGLLLCLLSSVSSAHLLKVFAYAEGNQIRGKVYFAGGSYVPNTSVKIIDTTQAYSMQSQTDAQGKFSFSVPHAADYIVSADANDGHTASWKIRASQLAPQLSSDQSQADTAFVSGAKVQLQSVDNTELEALVARAVARQVEPLSTLLIAQQERVKLQDVIGALGYIAGVFGALMWWRQRREKQ